MRRKKIALSTQELLPVAGITSTNEVDKNQLDDDIWARLCDRLKTTSAERFGSNSVPELSTLAGQTNSGGTVIPELSLLHISEPIPTSPDATAAADIGPFHASESRRFGKDVRRLLKIVQEAILNPLYIPWDVGEYYTECVLARSEERERNRSRFPLPSLGKHNCPLTIVDSKGHIVLWYLPGLLSTFQQHALRRGTLSIRQLLRASVRKKLPSKSAPNWRVYKKNFVPRHASRSCEPGAVTFSAGWFAQAHDTDKYPLRPSVNLRSNQLHLGGRRWLVETQAVEIFLSLTLSLIHPDLHMSGKHMLEKLQALETTGGIAANWYSVYTGIQVISNRVTPGHRDSKGRPEWYDILAGISGGSLPCLLVKDLGLELEYSSGSVVGLCGSILEHEVRAWGAGDRVCYAHFMREAVRKRLGVEPAGWAKQNVYGQFLPDKVTSSKGFVM